MTTVTVVIQNAPYNSDSKASDAVRFALAALVQSMSVRVFLLGDGVKVGLKGQKPPEDATNLEQLLIEIMECDVEIRACGVSLDDCAIGVSTGDCTVDEASMIDGIERSTMTALASWVKDSDQVMVF